MSSYLKHLPAFHHMMLLLVTAESLMTSELHQGAQSFLFSWNLFTANTSFQGKQDMSNKFFLSAFTLSGSTKLCNFKQDMPFKVGFVVQRFNYVNEQTFFCLITFICFLFVHVKSLGLLQQRRKGQGKTLGFVH